MELFVDGVFKSVSFMFYMGVLITFYMGVLITSLYTELLLKSPILPNGCCAVHLLIFLTRALIVTHST